MEDLLTKLYYGQIDIANKKPDNKRSSKEEELYDKLEKSLSSGGCSYFIEKVNGEIKKTKI